jgi:hypothetical protein
LINIFQLSIYVQINNDIGFTAKEIKKNLIVLSLYICFDVFKINVNVCTRKSRNDYHNHDGDYKTLSEMTLMKAVGVAEQNKLFIGHT